MPAIEIVAVRGRRDKKKFFHLPWELYRDDPFWIPPLRRNQWELLGFAAHPFYDRAKGQAFYAVRDGTPCGRIHAMVNDAHNERYEAHDGFFGFFETIDDQEVADALFAAAAQWLAAEGMTTIRGPINPSLNYELGLLIDGFDEPPTFMMTYNRPFYERLVEQAGFAKLKDLYAFWGHVEMLDTMDTKISFLSQEVIRRFNISLRPMNPRKLSAEVQLFLEIYNRSLVGTWGAVPLSPREAEHMAKGLKHLIVPQLTSIAEIDGKPIGAVLALLDYNPRIKAIDGRLFPFGFLKLLRNRGAIGRARVISANVLPEYQQWGVGLALLSELEKVVRATEINEAEFSWVLEDNHLSRRSLEHSGVERKKTYRLYERNL